VEYFGKINNGEMILSDTGKIVDQIWNEIPVKFENVKLDVYQIMPDHFHGIIKIKSDDRGNLIHQIQNKENFINEIPTKSGIKNNPMELKSISLGRIIRWFKGRVKYETDKITPGFKWQSRFYDRIIRDEREFYFISEYIINNPLNWGTKILKNYFT
jgi:REP element-mobilizing transposase RayT